MAVIWSTPGSSQSRWPKCFASDLRPIVSSSWWSQWLNSTMPLLKSSPSFSPDTSLVACFSLSSTRSTKASSWLSVYVSSLVLPAQISGWRTTSSKEQQTMCSCSTCSSSAECLYLQWSRCADLSSFYTMVKKVPFADVVKKSLAFWYICLSIVLVFVLSDSYIYTLQLWLMYIFVFLTSKVVVGHLPYAPEQHANCSLLEWRL